MTVRIFHGDCRDVLKTLPSESVHCVVTSPPYHGLRDYGVAGQIGLEPTCQEFVAEMVKVFREVRRVLRNDGVCWINLGDSYSSGVSNCADLLASELKGGVLFYGGADPCRRSAECINILLYDKRSPDLELFPLFAAQRISIKQGQDHLCQIGGFFDAPVLCSGSSAFRWRIPHDTAQGAVNLSENIGIIVAAGDLHADATLCKSAAHAMKHGKASLAVKIAGEPISEGITGRIPVWDAVSLNSGAESTTQVDPVNEPIPLLDCSELLAGRGNDFSVREASGEHLALALHRGCQLTFLRVSHLFASVNGLTPYSRMLDQAQRKANAGQAKQELGIPDLVKRALMEDGWICRQTIIWAKPNPMPESVTDRCTKSHEYLFLMSKSARYFFDAEAIKEPLSEGSIERYEYAFGGAKSEALIEANKTGVGQRTRVAGMREATNGRNKRSVWEVATAPFSEAHFATFPPALIEPCIKAGCPKGGTVLDPFGGAGTTGLVADRLQRNAILVELNPTYATMAERRIHNDAPLFAEA